MNVVGLSFRSLRSRAPIVFLVVLNLSLSIALYIGVVSVERMSRASFENSISGVDLILAPRGNDMQILLYTVFNIGEPGGLISGDSLDKVAQDPDVDWLVPIALGDSFKGFRVIGTTPRFFNAIEVRRDQPLQFAMGQQFNGFFDVVIGSRVASDLGLNIGDAVTIQHGMGGINTASHDRLPFQLSGVMEPTGTAFDQVVLIRIQALEGLHVGWRNGQELMGLSSDDIISQMGLRSNYASNAAFVGVKSPLKLFSVQRRISELRGDALSAVIPGVGLAKLWQLIGSVEAGFQFIAMLVIAAAVISMVAMTMASLDSRRRELAILRSVGASPMHLVLLLLVESIFIAVNACLMGIAISQVGTWVGSIYLEKQFGLVVGSGLLHTEDLWVLVYVIGAAIGASGIPALKLYRRTVNDGITVKL
jgi:putative ABC transport system permease protein